MNPLLRWRGPVARIYSFIFLVFSRKLLLKLCWKTNTANMVATSTLKTKSSECISELVDRRYDQACIEKGRFWVVFHCVFCLFFVSASCALVYHSTAWLQQWWGAGVAGENEVITLQCTAHRQSAVQTIHTAVWHVSVNSYNRKKNNNNKYIFICISGIVLNIC